MLQFRYSAAPSSGHKHSYRNVRLAVTLGGSRVVVSFELRIS